jgi:hypothetical protein
VKRHLLFIITGLALLWSTSSHAVVGELGDSDGYNDNPHNLSSLNNLSGNKQKAVTETQICIFCHTPHGATPDSPLWGRPNPIGPVGGFPTFAIASIQDPGPPPNLGIDDATIIGTTGYVASGSYPNGASKLCLSCHDGVTAMGILANGKEIDMDMTGLGQGKALKVIDLSKSHPISFIYTQAVETYLNSVAATKLYNFIYYNAPPKTIPLDKYSRIQCTICHEPHKSTKTGTYALPFWRMKGTGIDAAADYDNTCQQCHDTTYYTYPNPIHNIP